MSLLGPRTKPSEIEELCRNKCRSVLIPPAFVQYAKGVSVTVTVGSPYGYDILEKKFLDIVPEADEFEISLNIGLFRSGRYLGVLNELVKIRQRCGDRPCRVNIQSPLLTKIEQVAACQVVKDSGIKCVVLDYKSWTPIFGLKTKVGPVRHRLQRFDAADIIGVPYKVKKS